MARLAIRMPKMSMTMTEGEVAELDRQGRRRDRRGRRRLRGDDRQGRHGGRVAPSPAPSSRSSSRAAWSTSASPSPGSRARTTAAASATCSTEPEPEPEPTQPRAAVVERAPDAASPAPPAVAQRAASDRRDHRRPPGPPAAVPRARGLAREHGIDLATVSPTGPDGLMRVPDVEAPRHPGPTAGAGARADPTAPAAAAAPAEDDKALKRRTAVRRAVARVMMPSGAIPQFTVWREVHLDAANAAPRRPVLDHRAAAGVRRRAAPGTRAAVAAGRTTRRRQRAAQPSRWRSPPTAACWCRPSWSPTWATRASWTRRCARSSARPSRARWTAPTWRSPTDRCPTSAALGVDRFQALLTPPQASVLSLGSIRQRPVAVPGGVGLALTVAGRPHRRPPGGRRRARSAAAAVVRDPAGRRPGSAL